MPASSPPDKARSPCTVQIHGFVFTRVQEARGCRLLLGRANKRLNRLINADGFSSSRRTLPGERERKKKKIKTVNESRAGPRVDGVEGWDGVKTWRWERDGERGREGGWAGGDYVSRTTNKRIASTYVTGLCQPHVDSFQQQLNNVQI